MALGKGAICYFLDSERSWTLGRIEEWDGKHATVESTPTEHNPDLFTASKVPEERLFVTREDCIDEDVEDLLHLTLLHDATLLACLKTRYFKDVIYTNIGAIVVAINPFNFKIPWYSDDNMSKYLAEGPRIERNIPHSWAAAHNTYHEMLSMRQNQTILVSGESGAGKTEASKIVFKYLAAIAAKKGGRGGSARPPSGNTLDQSMSLSVKYNTTARSVGAASSLGFDPAADNEIGTRINRCSPPLEAFGNAKTVRNDNSSRFGKFMRVKFDSSGVLKGAHITKYLLEKSRIVSAMPNERCYHSFYLLCRSDESFRAKYNIGDVSAYKSLNSGGCTSNKDYDCADDFSEVIDSMDSIGLPADKVDSIWRVVAGIMHIQNIGFDEAGEGVTVSAAAAEAVASTVAVLKISEPDFRRELATTEMEVMGQLIVKELKKVQAVDGRDAVCKSLYDGLFSWFIEECNAVLDVKEEETAGGNWIGLLDIFGFEDFEINSFEQLCINLANETLQNHYNTYIFLRDMDECRAEGIDVTSVSFPDNAPCISMITSRTGLLSLLDEQCAVGSGTDDGFLATIVQHHSANPFFEKKILAKSQFIVHHYAGSVSYTVDGFLDKNRDTLKDGWKALINASEDGLIASFVPTVESPGGKKSAPKATAGGFFKSQLNDLMDLINSTNPHWIRCVKPHPAKKPKLFHAVETMKQLSSAGVLGTVKIRKAGYPVRIPFDDFYARYIICASGKGIAQDPKEAACRDIVEKIAGFDAVQAQIGKSRVFLKSDAYIALETLKRTVLTGNAQTAQAWGRAYAALQLRVKRRIHEMNAERIAHIRKQVLRRHAFIAKEATEREEMRSEETSDWEALCDAYVYFVDTTLAELLELEDRKIAEEREQARLERERIERIEADRLAIERRKADRERKRLDQRLKEKELFNAVTALNQRKMAEVQNEIEEMRRNRKVSEEIERRKAAQKREETREQIEEKHRKMQAVRDRHDGNVKSIEEYEQELSQQVRDKTNWSELLVNRSRVGLEQKQFIRGIATELRASEGKTRVLAQQQRFKRMTELKQSAKNTRDFLRIQNLEEQRNDVLNKRRLERIGRVEKKRREAAVSSGIKSARHQLDRAQWQQRSHWDRLLEKENRVKQERAYRRAAEVREERAVLHSLEDRIERGLALQEMEEQRQLERAKSSPAPRARSLGPGGTRTSNAPVHVEPLQPIDDGLHARLMGSPQTAAAGTLNDTSVRQKLTSVSLGAELPRSSLHWVP